MSDKPERLSPFEQAMMEMHAQEKPKECDHHWRYLSFDTKVSSKYNECEHDWKKLPNDKCIENVLNFSQYRKRTEEDYSRCVFRNPNTYTKEKHFNDTLNIFLGYKNPKEDVVEFASSLPNNITKTEIRQEIKRQRKTGLARFLRNIHQIATGIELKPV